MSALREYRRKRDFDRTPEPTPGKRSKRDRRIFVVQKHDATALHYDLRIEMAGVLWSWAVPKGPSLDPKEKRLAIRTEDHPIEYAEFEGVIPEGEYGGGTMMIWDKGLWSPLVDVDEAMAKGNLKIDLRGDKLQGAWALVRTKSGESDKQWLLIKERDDHTVAEDVYSITAEEPFSAATGRSIPEISANDEPRAWVLEPDVLRRGQVLPGSSNAAAVTGAKRTRKQPPLATPKPAKSPPAGDGWLHELLHTGRRVRVEISEDAVRIVDRASDPLTARRVPLIAAELTRLPVASGLLDGIITVLDRQGAGRESLLTASLAPERAFDAVCILYDLPSCDGFYLGDSPLIERKELLKTLVNADNAYLRVADHVLGEGPDVAGHAEELGANGIVSRPAGSPYPAGKRNDWREIRFDSKADKSPKPAPPAKSDQPAVLRGVSISNPRRVLYPEQRVTKGMLAEYYEAVADRMLPHVAGRPLSIVRGPKGVDEQLFFQKRIGEMPGEHLSEFVSEDPEGTTSYLTLTDVRGLLGLAQWSALEIHTWGCRADRVEKPDRVIFDLDPGPGVEWQVVIEGAQGLRFLLAEAGLESWVKTSGGKGLHVIAPITRRPTWDDVKRFAEGIARKVADAAPKHFTVNMSKDLRIRRVFIDYFRNIRGATCAAAYSSRARREATVSMPLGWDELNARLRQVSMSEALSRLGADDPWAGLVERRQQLRGR